YKTTSTPIAPESFNRRRRFPTATARSNHFRLAEKTVKIPINAICILKAAGGAAFIGRGSKEGIRLHAGVVDA
ncbi:hypothetical protein HDU67_002838, partial [Dinochytrium kinnereticum]